MKILWIMWNILTFLPRLFVRFLRWFLKFRTLGKFWVLEHGLLAFVALYLLTPLAGLAVDMWFAMVMRRQEVKATRVALDALCGKGDSLACKALMRGDERIPFEADYNRGNALDYQEQWEMYTNSEWLADQCRLIIPFFAFEGITSLDVGQYPQVVAFVPFGADRSLTIPGTTLSQDRVYLNERLVTDDYWNDQREVKIVTVHELIHAQGGTYYKWPPENWESTTSAATLETLAAMCHTNDKMACAAFWTLMNSTARGNVRYQFERANLAWLYHLWADLYLRGDEDSMWSRKLQRWYDSQGDALEVKLYRYDFLPWQKILMPAMRGIPMATGFTIPRGSAWMEQGLEFDDMNQELGWLRWIAWVRR